MVNDDEEFDLDFLNIMDKALSDSELQKDHPSAFGSEAPGVKSLIPAKDPAHVEVRSSSLSIQDRSIPVDQFNNLLMLLNNSLEPLIADGDSK